MGRKWHGIYANIPEGKKVTVFKIGFHVRIDIQQVEINFHLIMTILWKQMQSKENKKHMRIML